MKAVLLIDERLLLSELVVAELVAWELPKPLAGSTHNLKYRFALMSSGVCVLRYDNEAGKGDHLHRGRREFPYRFVDLEELQADFWKDVEAWLNRKDAL